MMINSDACISLDKKFRYWLKRTWDNDKPMVAYLMLNPSYADAHVNDTTINNCIAIAKNNGYGGLHVVNIFAYREPQKGELKSESYPVGTENDFHIKDIFSQVNEIILAYGNPDNKIVKERIKEVLGFITNQKLKCIEKTKDNYPLHPGAQALNRRGINPTNHLLIDY